MYSSQGSSVSIVSGYRLDDQAIQVHSPAEANVFPLTFESRLALGPIQPLVQWVLGVLSPGVKCDLSPSSAEVVNE
jgi:hypothetical protein